MKVKLFSGSGASGIQIVEKAVNIWLSENPNISVLDRQTAMCTTGQSGEGDQCLVISIWYVERTA